MTAANALRCIANTHREEGSDTKSGGWTLNRNDPGNWTGGKVGAGELRGTKFGIAANTYPTLDIRNLTREQADAIYIRDYWPKAWGNDWPEGFDQITYDATVNSGPGRGPLWTCRALGFLKADRSAPAKAKSLSADAKIAAIKNAVSKQRMGFLRALGSFQHFGKGWTGRCARMEAIGVKMVLEYHGQTRSEITKRLEQESKTAGKTSKANGTAAGGTVTGGAGGATQVDPSQVDWTTWVGYGALFVVAVALVAFFVWQYLKHRERSAAYAAVASEA